MTDLLTTDNADSGEVVRLNPAIVDTFVLDAADLKSTRSLSSFAKTLPPTRVLRRPDATGEQPLYRPQTIGIVDPFAAPVAEYPVVRLAEPAPDVRPRGHRRPRPSRPPRMPWSPLARRALRCWIGLAVVEVAILAPLVVTL